MNQTIRQIPSEKCTGCGACLNKCPKNAIRMELNEEGFYFPTIDESLCVNCGLCLKTCPLTQESRQNVERPNCYAVWADDETRHQSSSGGVFTLLANWALEQGGIVVGAAYTNDCYAVKHLIIDKKTELSRLRGSKYVQSDTGFVYRKIQKHLTNGQIVLFTGCPCQIAALYAYLGTTYSTLYTVEVVCHGVPAPGLFERFIKEKEAEFHSKAITVNMRDKTVAAWDPALSIRFENGEKGQWKRNESSYLRVFLNAVDIRPSCGNCLFAKLPRTADLTIADFWDVHRYNPTLDDRKGTSAVLVNNEKGELLYEILRKRAKLCVKAPLEHATKYNAQMVRSSIHNEPKRTRFYRLLNEYHFTLEKAVDYVLNDKYDIGYIGWWYGANYGSALTSFALNRVLKAMGKTVLMLDFPIVNGPVPKIKRNTPTRRFAKKYYDDAPLTALADYHKYNKNCETFLVGSDQLWNWWSNRDVKTYFYFLDFVEKEKKKIAYSTSFGHENVHYPENMRLRIAYYMQRFDAISTREKSGVTTCKRDFDVVATHTIDPVFLCDVEEYARAAARSQKKTHKRYVLGYILNPTEDKKKAIQLISKQLDLPYHIILDGQANFDAIKQQMNDPNVLENVEIEDWLSLIQHADYLVTDSYHGFCFSIIFKRPMSVIPNVLRGLTRFEDLAELTGLTSRFEYSYQDFVNHQPWNIPIDFTLVDNNLRNFKKDSYEWLASVLVAPKTPVKSKGLVLWKTLEYEQRIHKLEETIQALGVVNHVSTSNEVQANDIQRELLDIKQRLFALEKAFLSLPSPPSKENTPSSMPQSERQKFVDGIASIGSKCVEILENETARLIMEKRKREITE